MAGSRVVPRGGRGGVGARVSSVADRAWTARVQQNGHTDRHGWCVERMMTGRELHECPVRRIGHKQGQDTMSTLGDTRA